MPYEFKLPDIGEGVAEGEITKWLVKEGDSVKEDQPMVEVMTDKATVEITSPVGGRVQKILVKEGGVAPVHSVIVVIEQIAGGAAAPAVATPPAPAAKPAPAPAPKPAAPVTPPAPAPRAAAPTPQPAAKPAPVAAPAAAAPAQPAVVAPAAPATPRDKVLATPATRKLARELGVDLAQVAGSGPRGRVLKDDVRSVLAPVAEPAQPNGGEPVISRAVESYAPTPAGGAEERIPYRGLRKAIGDQMVRSLYTAPHFTLVDEIDFSAIDGLRQASKDEASAAGTKLTYLPFVMKALFQTIRKFPSINATLDEARGEFVIKHDVHVGFALDTDRGLMVPVVKNVARRGVLSIAKEISRLSELGRAGKASREDLIGSTITITSAGSIGGLFATPIINYPEVAILGLYQIADRPVVRDGQIVIRKMGYVSITLDHRVVDGATASRVLLELKRLLGNPGLLLLGD